MCFESECPVCFEKRDFPNDTIAGEQVVCLDCGRILKVKSVQPFVVDESSHQGECWGE